MVEKPGLLCRAARGGKNGCGCSSLRAGWRWSFAGSVVELAADVVVRCKSWRSGRCRRIIKQKLCLFRHLASSGDQRTELWRNGARPIEGSVRDASLLVSRAPTISYGDLTVLI